MQSISEISGENYRITKLAFEALREAAESQLVCTLEDAYLLAIHAKRVTLMKCDMKSYEIVTRAHGNLKEQVSRTRNQTNQTRLSCSIDQFSTLIAVKEYDGIIKFIPISNECKQLNVQTLRFLYYQE